MESTIYDSRGYPATVQKRAKRMGPTQRIGTELVEGFSRELAAIKRQTDDAHRTNSLQSLADGFTNPYGNPYGSGLTQPWTIANSNAYVPISLNRIELSYGYMSQPLIRNAVNSVVNDAFRGGFEIKSPELEEQDIAQLQNALKRTRGRRERRRAGKNDIAKVNTQSGDDLSASDIQVVKKTCQWARLFGGAGMLINCDQDFTKELDVEAIREDSPLQFMDADRWELVLGSTNIWDERIACPYNYYGLPLHHSRVVKVMGDAAPSYIRLRLQGWGMSFLEQCMRQINLFIKYENLVFELLDEAKIDVYKITGFNTALMSDVATSAIHRRIALGNQLKNFQNAITMDATDEYDQKQLTFTGIADIWDRLCLSVCGAVQIPRTKLFGDSSSGFGSGEDALENYNSVVESVRENDCDPLMMEVVELRCQQLFGFIPEDIELKWKALKQMDGDKEEDMKTKRQARALGLFQSGLTTGEETSTILKNDGLLDIDTEVSQGLREAAPPMSQNPDEMELGAKLASQSKKQDETK